MKRVKNALPLVARVRAAVVLVPILLFALATQASAQQINLFTGSIPAFASAFLAEDMGLFKEAGVDVKVTPFASGSAAAEAFRAGRGDVVNAADLPSIKLWQRGEGVGVALTASFCKNSLIVGRKELTGPRDLKGKTVATLLGSTAEFFTHKYLASGGLSIGDITLKNLAPADMVIALARGDIDAFVLWEPFGTQALKVTQGQAHVLTYGCGFFNEYVLLNVSHRLAAERPEDVGKIIKAIRMAESVIANRPDAAAKTVAQRLKADVALTKELIGRITFTSAHTKSFEADMNALAEFMIGRELLSEPIAWSKAFDTRFLKKIDPALAQR